MFLNYTKVFRVQLNILQLFLTIGWTETLFPVAFFKRFQYWQLLIFLSIWVLVAYKAVAYKKNRVIVTLQFPTEHFWKVNKLGEKSKIRRNSQIYQKENSKRCYNCFDIDNLWVKIEKLTVLHVFLYNQ